MEPTGSNRKLAAILMADVVGYSRLMGLDEARLGMDWWTEQAEGLRGRIDRGEPFRWFAPYVNGRPG